MQVIKIYSNKSNAHRFGKKEFGPNNYTISPHDQGFSVHEMPKQCEPNPILKPSAKQTIQRESSVQRPCFVVWDIADKMPGARRKDVVAACVAKGVAFYTARTQYQLWKQCQNEMKAGK